MDLKLYYFSFSFPLFSVQLVSQKKVYKPDWFTFICFYIYELARFYIILMLRDSKLMFQNLKHFESSWIIK